MPTVDRTRELLDSLRQEVTTRLRGKRSSSTSTAASSDTSLLLGLSVEGVKERIGRELKPHDLDTPEGRKLARQTFVESVLAWEMGDDIARDQRFGFIVREVETSMSLDEKLCSALDGILRTLREQHS